MENHEEIEVTSYFSYQDLFPMCKTLSKETSKLEKIVFNSKDTIFSLELKNKSLVDEIEILEERQDDMT